MRRWGRANRCRRERNPLSTTLLSLLLLLGGCSCSFFLSFRLLFNISATTIIPFPTFLLLRANVIIIASRCHRCHGCHRCHNYLLLKLIAWNILNQELQSSLESNRGFMCYFIPYPLALSHHLHKVLRRGYCSSFIIEFSHGGGCSKRTADAELK